jgi:hypothetical protein
MTEGQSLRLAAEAMAKSIKPVLLDDGLASRQLFAILVLVTFLLVGLDARHPSSRTVHGRSY